MFENLGSVCEILIRGSGAYFNSIKELTDILTLTDKVQFIHRKQHFEQPQKKANASETVCAAVLAQV